MSATIRDVAESLGISERAVRLRVDALGGVVAPHLRRGPNNALVFTGEALAVLRQLEDKRRTDGISVNEAARIMKQSSPDSESPRPSASKRASSEEVAVLRELVEELRADRDAWRALALQLQNSTPALPAPRGILARLFGRRQ